MIYNITISDSLTCRFSGGIAVPEKFITVFHPDKCIYNDLIMSRFFFFFLWKGTGSQYQIITTWISWTKEHLNTQKKQIDITNILSTSCQKCLSVWIFCLLMQQIHMTNWTKVKSVWGNLSWNYVKLPIMWITWNNWISPVITHQTLLNIFSWNPENVHTGKLLFRCG